MKRLTYSLLLIHSRTHSRIRQIRIAGILFLGCFFLVCAIGFARFVYFTTLYGQASFGYYKERISNEHLQLKIYSLDKLLLKEKGKLNDLVVFEDIARLTFGMDPISPDVRKAGIGGAPSRFEREEMGSSTFSNQLFIKTVAVKESLSTFIRKLELQKATFEQMGDHVERLYESWSQRPSIWPAAGRITSGFGMRTHPIFGEALFHDGIDIANERGTPIYAPAKGIVKEVGMRQNYGKAICIEHPENNLETLYGHLHYYTVRAGENINRGDLIGYIGTSGNSTGPHLHYEIRKEGRPINPMQFILPSDEMVD